MHMPYDALMVRRMLFIIVCTLHTAAPPWRVSGRRQMRDEGDGGCNVHAIAIQQLLVFIGEEINHRALNHFSGTRLC
eukprot:scaffold25788_cov143-Isochrysis_galbana.AAC.3